MTETRMIQISQPLTGEEEWLALKAPLESGWLTQGPQVSAFEQRFAEKHEVDQALPDSLLRKGGTRAFRTLLPFLLANDS